MTHKALEHEVTGIKCDAPTCDFRDENVSFESYPDWLNRPCPKCGANLLTQTDFDTVTALFDLISFVNKVVGPIDGDKPMNVTPIRFEFDGNGISNISFPRTPKGDA